MKTILNVLFAAAMFAVARPAAAGDISWRNTGVCTADDGNGTKVFTSSSLFTDARGVAKVMGSANSASLFQMTSTVANCATVTCSTNVLSLKVTIANQPMQITNTVFLAAAFGGTENVIVIPTGVTGFTLRPTAALSATGPSYADNLVVNNAENFTAIGTGMVATPSSGYTEEGLDVGATGSTRYACSTGLVANRVGVQFRYAPRVCISRVSMAQAAAGNGYIIGPGDVYNFPDMGGSVSQAFYLAPYHTTNSVIVNVAEALKEN